MIGGKCRQPIDSLLGTPMVMRKDQLSAEAIMLDRV
jgi:hypothetical protein